jgi:hypothetical protein
MQKIGLYHPQLLFPSDAWVKTAALYWTKMARIVPFELSLADSDTVKALRHELDFVVDVPPLRTLYHCSACFEFLGLMTIYGEQLRRRYREVDIPVRPRSPAMRIPRESSQRSISTIVPSAGILDQRKLSMEIGYALERHELAVRAHGTYRMHPALARVYMSAMAEDLARSNHLLPVTDDSDVYAVGTGWTRERMQRVLLPELNDIDDGVLKQHERPDFSPPAIAMLAIQAVVPRDVGQLPVKKIIELRQQFKPQFDAFRDAVDTAAAEIAERLQSVEDTAVLRAFLTQEINDRFTAPVRELRKEMRKLNVDTTVASITTKYEVPALAGLVSTGILTQQPVLAGGAAAAFGLLGIVRGMRDKKEAVLKRSPVSYLMLIEDRLGAHARLRQVARYLHGVVG